MIVSVNCLKRLHDLKFAIYQPQTDVPKIHFLCNRIHTAHVEINEEMQIHLKKIEIEKLNKAIHYAVQVSNCRSKEILNYFDEADAKPCGVCDVCLSQFSKQLSTERFNLILKEIKKHLNKEKVEAVKLISLLPFPKHQIELVLKYLIENELVRYNKKNELILK